MRWLQFFKPKELQLKTLAKNSSWVLGGNLTRALFLFLKGVIVARALGVELFGTYNIIIAFAGLVHQLFSLPIGSTLIKYGSNYFADKEHNKLSAIIRASVVVSVCLAALSFVTIVLLTLLVYDVFLEDPDLETFVVAYALIAASIFIDGISNSVLRLFHRFKENSILVLVIAAIDFTIIASTVMIYKQNFIVFFIAVLTSKFIGSAVLNIYTYRFLNTQLKARKVSVKILREESRRLFSYTAANSGSRMLKTLINNGDVLLLGALSGPVSVGFYNVAKKLAQSILIVIDPMTTTLFPQLSVLIAQRKMAEILSLIQRIVKILILPLLLFVSLIFFMKEEIIQLAYGVEYLGAADAFLFLTINAALAALLFWNLPLILSLEMVKLRFYINAVALTIGAIIAYTLIPNMGATGASIGLLVANGLAVLVFSFSSFNKVKKLAA